MTAPLISISDSPNFFKSISYAEIFLKKWHTISLVYLDYFEWNNNAGHRIGKEDKGLLFPLHP